MEKYIIRGGNKLKGSVNISGAKNAAVAIIPATILAEGNCVIENVPNIRDVTIFLHILRDIGAQVRVLDEHTLEINTVGINKAVATSELVRKLRASCYLMGALLGRFKSSLVTLPGGCDFGVRPIDQHLKGFSALGASSCFEAGAVSIKSKKLTGNSIYLDVASVGATINIILAAVKAKGKTTIENAAREPHIVDLANFLNSMGANIVGAGTNIIRINGVEKLKATNYSIIPDQIEAGTYMIAAAATNGNIKIDNIIPKHLESITAKLREIGVKITEEYDSIQVSSSGRLKPCTVKTMPYPGFPTDMQPQIVALLSTSDGTSIVSEDVWDNRFKYVSELTCMGAKITVDGRMAVIEGVKRLKGSPVSATDLRAGAAMIISGLSAEGITEISNINHIERGYEDIVNKLKKIGANIEYVNIAEEGNTIPKAF